MASCGEDVRARAWKSRGWEGGRASNANYSNAPADGGEVFSNSSGRSREEFSRSLEIALVSPYDVNFTACDFTEEGRKRILRRRKEILR